MLLHSHRWSCWVICLCSTWSGFCQFNNYVWDVLGLIHIESCRSHLSHIAPTPWHKLLVIRAKNNFQFTMLSKVWDEISSPFPFFNASAVEVWGWRRNFIPHIILDVITHACGTIILTSNLAALRCHGIWWEDALSLNELKRWNTTVHSGIFYSDNISDLTDIIATPLCHPICLWIMFHE